MMIKYSQDWHDRHPDENGGLGTNLDAPVPHASGAPHARNVEHHTSPYVVISAPGVVHLSSSAETSTPLRDITVHGINSMTLPQEPSPKRHKTGNGS
eukprot:scaffold71349_cov15-Prasinocladus_malaysianus.AAC.1